MQENRLAPCNKRVQRRIIDDNDPDRVRIKPGSGQNRLRDLAQRRLNFRIADETTRRRIQGQPDIGQKSKDQDDRIASDGGTFLPRSRQINRQALTIQSFGCGLKKL